MSATLLIIEDNLELLRLLRELLSERFRVVTAVNGEQGLEAARSEPPDLALVDVDLPGIDGVETALRLKAERAPTPLPILILTAHASAGQEARIRATGCCDDFLSKPAPLLEISRRLDLLLERSVPAASGVDPHPLDDGAADWSGDARSGHPALPHTGD